jgi:hypothetical protein
VSRKVEKEMNIEPKPAVRRRFCAVAERLNVEMLPISSSVATYSDVP